MNRQVLKTAILWGFLLWLIGYGLGIALFTIVPSGWIGWIITPIGIAISLWVLFKKIAFKKFYEYLMLSFVWTGIAVIFDYFFLVRPFNPTAYYKLDVYLYYLLTFVLPLGVYWIKTKKKEQ